MKISVLYFDDEAVLLNLFEDMFRHEYDVLTESTLTGARAALSKQPDIIISDWSMPEIMGTDFLREAMNLSPGSFRILLTGYGKVGDLFTEIISGVVQLFIKKPWTESEMRDALVRAALTLNRR